MHLIYWVMQICITVDGTRKNCKFLFIVHFLTFQHNYVNLRTSIYSSSSIISPPIYQLWAFSKIVLFPKYWDTWNKILAIIFSFIETIRLSEGLFSDYLILYIILSYIIFSLSVCSRAETWIPINHYSHDNCSFQIVKSRID